MSFLELHDIHKSYYLDNVEFPVLKGIDLSFDLGEFVSILGESGGGKSTLMNIIGGLDRQFKGSVLVGGKALDHKDQKEMDAYRRETVGYIYQSYNLISHLTVIENVMVPLEMTTLTSQQRYERAQRLLDKVGLGGQISKYPQHLSGGQKQRVAIARALASDPKVIIADEPTGALDAENTKEVLLILKKIASEGRLVITVTHSQEVAQTGTRIVHMENGKIDEDEQVNAPYAAMKKSSSITPRLLPASSSYRNAAKHLRFNFWRNMLIVLGVTIGLFSVILFTGIGNGTNKYVDQQITDMTNPRVISVSAYSKAADEASDSMTAVLGSMTSSQMPHELSDKQIDLLEKIKNVESVSPSYTATSVNASFNGKNTTIQSVKNWNAASAESGIVSGSKPKHDEILLDKSDAKKINKDWKSLVGKKLSLSYKSMDTRGVMKTVSMKVRVSGIAEAKNSMGMTDLTTIDTATLTDALKASGLSTHPASVSVIAHDMDDVETVVHKIKTVKNGEKRVFTAFGMTGFIKTVKKYVKLVSYILSGIAAISLIVSALMIIVTMFMSVSSRTKEIGILRALGESKKDIRRLFTSESLLLGLLSATFATVLAFGLGALANVAIASIADFSIVQITFGNVAMVYIMAVLISLLAAATPAWHAARLNPIDALASE